MTCSDLRGKNTDDLIKELLLFPRPVFPLANLWGPLISHLSPADGIFSHHTLM